MYGGLWSYCSFLICHLVTIYFTQNASDRPTLYHNLAHHELITNALNVTKDWRRNAG